MSMASNSGGYEFLRSIWRSALKMPRSIIAFVIAFLLSILSMGALGAALYLPAGLILEPHFGALESWTGDWVWPTMIMAGLFWSPAFLLAGAVNLWLQLMGRATLLCRVVYVLVVLGFSLPAWILALALQIA